jgi:uncharacterized HAD superfamily protein
MFSYLRRGKIAKFGELGIAGDSMAIHGQIFYMKDLKFSIEKAKDSNNIIITVRKKRFTKKGKTFVPADNIIKGEN